MSENGRTNTDPGERIPILAGAAAGLFVLGKWALNKRKERNPFKMRAPSDLIGSVDTHESGSSDLRCQIDIEFTRETSVQYLYVEFSKSKTKGFSSNTEVTTQFIYQRGQSAPLPPLEYCGINLDDQVFLKPDRYLLDIQVRLTKKGSWSGYLRTRLMADGKEHFRVTSVTVDDSPKK